MPLANSKRLYLKATRTLNHKAKFSALAVTACIVLAAPSLHAEEWTLHEQHLVTANAKIFSLELEIQELIQKKEALDDPAALKETLTEMVTKHKELTKIAAEREDELAHMRFKHPEKGDLSKREYSRYEIKTLEQMEAGQGIDGKLDRIKAIIETKYRIQAHVKRERPSSKPLRQPASVSTEERIVLKK